MHHDNLDDDLDDRHRSSKDDTALHFKYCIWVLCGGSKIQNSMDERDADNSPFIFRITNYHVQKLFPTFNVKRWKWRWWSDLQVIPKFWSVAPLAKLSLRLDEEEVN